MSLLTYGDGRFKKEGGKRREGRGEASRAPPRYSPAKTNTEKHQLHPSYEREFKKAQKSRGEGGSIQEAPLGKIIYSKRKKKTIIPKLGELSKHSRHCLC